MLSGRGQMGGLAGGGRTKWPTMPLCPERSASPISSSSSMASAGRADAKPNMASTPACSAGVVELDAIAWALSESGEEVSSTIALALELSLEAAKQEEEAAFNRAIAEALVRSNEMAWRKEDVRHQRL